MARDDVSVSPSTLALRAGNLKPGALRQSYILKTDTLRHPPSCPF